MTKRHEAVTKRHDVPKDEKTDKTDKAEKTEEVRQLISMGKEKGFLTYEELNNALPPGALATQQLDHLMTMFGEMDIEVVETPPEEARYPRMPA